MAENRQYELVYIVAPTASEQETADVQAQVQSAVERYSGKIDSTENWGRRKLAYEIGRHREGTYIQHVLTGPGEMVREIERRLRVFDFVIRYLVVRIDEDMRVAERAKAKRTAEVAARRAARGLPPLPEGAPEEDIDRDQNEEAEV